VEINIDEIENLSEWGIASAVFIGNRQIVTEPPPKQEYLQELRKRELK